MTPDFTFGDDPSERSGNGGPGMGGNSPVAGHCENRKKDADESDTDCGGIDCDDCGVGRTCSVAGDCANGSCTMGKCQDPTCTDGVKNEGETDVDCGGDGCPGCSDGEVCEGDGDCASDKCNGGTCAAPSCDDRRKNGNESDVDCGGSCDAGCAPGDDCVVKADCEQPPTENPATSQCDDGICTLQCQAGIGDCNQLASDGCEQDLLTELAHCGACGATCDPDNAVSPVCGGGECQIGPDGCKPGFADCDGDVTNGCEVDTRKTPAHCGGCFMACSNVNGTGSCTNSKCDTTCDTGFGSCDSEDTLRNGCETNLAGDINNCNGCGLNCPSGSGTDSPFCTAPTTERPTGCGLTACPAGTGDCDGDTSCSDNLTTVTNCGSCGNICSIPNGTPSCNGTSCQVGVCNTNYANCINGAADGCETDTRTNVEHCGGCSNLGGTDCSSKVGTQHVLTVRCAAKSCEITSCDPGWADCDGGFSNGCERNIYTTKNSCGGCRAGQTPAERTSTFGTGENCGSKWDNADGTCTGGVCINMVCDANFGDCNGGTGNGCETNLTTSPLANCDGDFSDGCEDPRTDKNNCGGCDIICGGAAQTNVMSASCATSMCNVTCTANFCPSGSDGLCNVSKGTTSNCTQCGEVCSGGTPFCDPTATPGQGCKDHRTVDEVWNAQVLKNLNCNGGACVASTANININQASSGYRGLLVSVSVHANSGFSEPDSVTYGSTTMVLVVESTAAQSAYSALYWLGECALAAEGNNKAVSVDWGSGLYYGGAVVNAALFENVEQKTPNLTNSKIASATSIAFNTLSVKLDSWVIAAVGSQDRVLSSITPAANQLSRTGKLSPVDSFFGLWGPRAAGNIQVTVANSGTDASAKSGVIAELEAARTVNSCP